MYPPIPSPRENKMKNRLYAAGSVVAWRCWRVSVLWRGKDRAGSVRLLVAEAAGHDTSRAARRACLAALKQLQPSRTMAVRRSSRSRRRSRPSDPSLDPGGVSPSRGTDRARTMTAARAGGDFLARKVGCQASRTRAYMRGFSRYLPTPQNCQSQLPNGWRGVFVLFGKNKKCQSQMANRWSCSY